MNRPLDHLRWPDPLEDLVDGLQHLTGIVVVDETDSTQDALSRLDPAPGTVLVAGRQTGGRGRLGRRWADDQGTGIAVSLAVAAEAPALLCARAAVAMARAYMPLLAGSGVEAGIKWPNDLMVLDPRPRKLAGVLIEQVGERAIIGIGVNVGARDWPAELAGTACSLEDAGASIERLEAITLLLRAWNDVADQPEEVLRTAFTEVELLTGRRVVFEEGGNLHEGLVESVDPFSGVLLRTDRGLMHMPPDQARMHAWSDLPD